MITKKAQRTLWLGFFVFPAGVPSGSSLSCLSPLRQLSAPAITTTLLPQATLFPELAFILLPGQ